MEQRNCKNCGAPLEHSYNHKCKYCGTLFDFNVDKEETIEFNSYDLTNTKYTGHYIYPHSNDIVLCFSGYKLEMPTIYEYDGKNNYISKVEEYVNPPKASFCVRLDFNELSIYGIKYIEYIIHKHINYRDYYDVRQQIFSDEELCRYIPDLPLSV